MPLSKHPSRLGTRIALSPNTQRSLWMQQATSWSLLNTHKLFQLMHMLKAWHYPLPPVLDKPIGYRGEQNILEQVNHPRDKEALRCQETLVSATSSISLLRGAS